MPDLYGLSERDLRKLRDIARRVGSGGGSQRPVTRRPRNPGGGKSGGLNLGGFVADVQLAILTKTIPARTQSLSYTGEEVSTVSITGGVPQDEAAIPLIYEDPSLKHTVWSDDHPTKAGQIKRLPAVNLFWDYQIFAGNGRDTGGGFANSQPIWSLGFITEGSEPFEEFFNIIWIDNPVTLIQALTTTAVGAGAAFNVDTATVQWGLMHKGTKINGVRNQPGWDANDNARALITRSVIDNAWVAIDLECPS